MATISVKYTDSKNLEICLPNANILQVEKTENSKSNLFLNEMIFNAINDNKLFSCLIEKAKIANKITIVVDDHTRHSPVKEALEVLREIFKKNSINWEKITLLIATGTHRFMTQDELKNKFGSLLKTTKIVQHDCKNSLYLRSYGEYKGIPILVNEIASADLTLAIGSIVPHRFSGWSGGAKMISPGISGYETIYKSHRMSIVDSNTDIGIIENPFRELIEEIADRVGLDFIINFYYSREGKIAGCVFGKPIEAHREGVRLARKNLEVVLEEKADLTIISSYPSMTDFWQAGKALYTADKITRDGGKIIMVSPLLYGLGDHPLFGDLLRKEKKAILELMDKNESTDPLAYVAAYAVRKILESRRVMICTRKELISIFSGFEIAVTVNIQDTVDEFLSQNPDARIAIFPNSLILPTVKNTSNTGVV